MKGAIFSSIGLSVLAAAAVSLPAAAASWLLDRRCLRLGPVWRLGIRSFLLLIVIGAFAVALARGGRLTALPSTGNAAAPRDGGDPSSAPTALRTSVTRIAGGVAGAAPLIGLAAVAAWIGLAARLGRDFARVRRTADTARSRGRRIALGEWGVTSRASAEAFELDWSVPPVTLGILRPVIVIPRWMQVSLDRDEARAILAHEAAHARPADGVLALALDAVRVLFFFQPLVSRIASRVRCDREEACDAEAVAITGDPLTLAGALAKLARAAAEHQAPLETVVGTRLGRGAVCDLRERVARLVGVPVPQSAPALRESASAWATVAFTLAAAAIHAAIPDGTKPESPRAQPAIYEFVSDPRPPGPRGEVLLVRGGRGEPGATAPVTALGSLRPLAEADPRRPHLLRTAERRMKR